MQGIAIVRLLKQIEARTQRRIHELFDLVCGTSTGGILAVALALKQMTLEQCEGIYRCSWTCSYEAACMLYAGASSLLSSSVLKLLL